MSVSQAPPVILTPPPWRDQQLQRQTSASRRKPRKRKRHLDHEELYEDAVLDWFDYLVNPHALDDQLAGIAKDKGKEEELLKQLIVPLTDTPTPTFSAPPILSPIEDRSAPVSPVEAALQTWSLTKKQAGLLHIIAEILAKKESTLTMIEKVMPERFIEPLFSTLIAIDREHQHAATTDPVQHRLVQYHRWRLRHMLASGPSAISTEEDIERALSFLSDLAKRLADPARTCWPSKAVPTAHFLTRLCFELAQVYIIQGANSMATSWVNESLRHVDRDATNVHVDCAFDIKQITQLKDLLTLPQRDARQADPFAEDFKAPVKQEKKRQEVPDEKREPVDLLQGAPSEVTAESVEHLLHHLVRLRRAGWTDRSVLSPLQQQLADLSNALVKSGSPGASDLVLRVHNEVLKSEFIVAVQRMEATSSAFSTSLLSLLDTFGLPPANLVSDILIAAVKTSCPSTLSETVSAAPKKGREAAFKTLLMLLQAKAMEAENGQLLKAISLTFQIKSIHQAFVDNIHLSEMALRTVFPDASILTSGFLTSASSSPGTTPTDVTPPVTSANTPLTMDLALHIAQVIRIIWVISPVVSENSQYLAGHLTSLLATLPERAWGIVLWTMACCYQACAQNKAVGLALSAWTDEEETALFEFDWAAFLELKTPEGVAEDRSLSIRSALESGMLSLIPSLIHKAKHTLFKKNGYTLLAYLHEQRGDRAEAIKCLLKRMAEASDFFVNEDLLGNEMCFHELTERKEHVLGLFFHQDLEHTADFYTKSMSVLNEGLTRLWKANALVSPVELAKSKDAQPFQELIHPLFEDLWIPEILEALVYHHKRKVVPEVVNACIGYLSKMSSEDDDRAVKRRRGCLKIWQYFNDSVM